MIDSVTRNLEMYMDLLSDSQKLTAANIANVDTPGYRTRTINFEEEYELARTTNDVHPRAVEVGSLEVKNDGNDVSIDRESQMLAQNALKFRLASSLLKDRFSMIKQAIQGDKS